MISHKNQGYMKNHTIFSVLLKNFKQNNNKKNAGFPTMNHILHDSYMEYYLKGNALLL